MNKELLFRFKCIFYPNENLFYSLLESEVEMPKRKKIDHAKLIKMVKDGTNQKQIMEKFTFGTSTQLKVAYLNALTQTGEAPEILTARTVKKEKAISKEVAVGKRGSIVIPKGLVEELGFKEGDFFLAKKTKVGISLSKK
jgi:hypothetical protein